MQTETPLLIFALFTRRQGLSITHPYKGENENMPVNAVTKECIHRNDPKFIPSQVVVPESFKEKVNNPIYQTLFTQELGFSLT